MKINVWTSDWKKIYLILSNISILKIKFSSHIDCWEGNEGENNDLFLFAHVLNFHKNFILLPAAE